jgi:hypothetical protein
MRRHAIACVIVITGILQLSTGAQTQPTTPPALPFAKQIRKTVTFIELICQSGGKLWNVRGTGFLLTFPVDSVAKGAQFIYLVTNRHVAECWDENEHPRPVKSISVRFNLRNGTSTKFPLNTSGNAAWIFPADESADLAIVGLVPDPNTVDYLTIPLSSLATDDVVAKETISEGSKIIFTGFFYQFPGERRMQPIIREGILAMMPDEDLVTTTGKSGKVYLGDVHIFGGNSGSPVFVDLGGLHGGAFKLGEDYRLLGVVSGMFHEDEEFKLEVTTTIKGTAYGNSGIAMIVPASALKKLLDDPRVRATRDAEVTKWQASHTSH